MFRFSSLSFHIPPGLPVPYFSSPLLYMSHIITHGPTYISPDYRQDVGVLCACTPLTTIYCS